MPGRLAARAGLLSIGLGACAAFAGAQAQDLALNPPLRALASQRGRWIGSCAAVGPLRSDPVYQRLLGGQFSMLTPENVMKFSEIHPGPNTYTFSGGDAVVAFARAHGMLVRGHTLVWHEQVPARVAQGHLSPIQLAAVLQSHIETVAEHYKGQLYSWDVVNEAVAWNGTLRPTLWSAIGPDYIARAFRWAHAADPSAKLFYNDFGAESSPAKADGIFRLLQGLLAQGVPVDGVGLQMHLTAGQNYGDFDALLRRFAGLGLEVHITELDVETATPETPELARQQADLYGRALAACLDEPACTAFVMWGFTDKYAWRAPQAPDILDASYRPKPAYQALMHGLGALDLTRPQPY